ncbi:MAG TPA: glycosyltransferase family 2 protein, partial [Bacteroidia bacterium]|nr:glycosyltransferase family 2 protein [Bacteroidia bacterium]
NPLVTVGIPTYNRPEGLRKVLTCVTQQTYKNLQIIVADNCSENENVSKIANEFAAKDPRVKYYRHEANMGSNFNFQFVLKKAEGEFFMWAADDDDRSLFFVEELMSVIKDRSAAFGNFTIRYEGTGREDHVKIDISAKGANKYEQAKNFLKERIPSLFYSLYRTEDIRWYSVFIKTFDWLDCYIILEIILKYNGFAFSDKELYSAGIQGENYQYKPARPHSKKIFSYTPYFNNSARLIFQSACTTTQKLKLIFYLFEVTSKSFMAIEKNRKSHRLYSFIYRIFSRIKPTT